LRKDGSFRHRQAEVSALDDGNGRIGPRGFAIGYETISPQQAKQAEKFRPWLRTVGGQLPALSGGARPSAHKSLRVELHVTQFRRIYLEMPPQTAQSPR
jgi:hypothetical protein